jgi:CDP-diacylglycerol--glycerol-3-phosphate 3-phosphatidyltransferase
VASYLNGINLTIPFIIAGVLFIIASASDALDGHIARKNNIITTFGKVFDPSADKILVNSTMVLFAATGRLPIFIPVIMIARDILVDATRIVLGNKNIVVPANA